MPVSVEKQEQLMKAKFLRSQPKSGTCTSCGKRQLTAAFGLRVMARDRKGLPKAIRRQSQCVPCRSGKNK